MENQADQVTKYIPEENCIIFPSANQPYTADFLWIKLMFIGKSSIECI